MKAIILAAGKGTRLKKYTENLPKGMLIFEGKTIIERQIEAYRRNGIEDISVVTGFASDKISYDNVKFYHNAEFEQTNMVESLLMAKEEFNDDIIISYSDILFSDEMLQGMIGANGDFIVAVDENWQAYWKMRYGRIDFDTESMKIDSMGNITSLGLPDAELKDIDARYVGILKISKHGLDIVLEVMKNAYCSNYELPWKQSGKPAKQAYMTDLLQAIIEENKKVKAAFFQNQWIEFDTNEDYEKACAWGKTGEIVQLIDLKEVREKWSKRLIEIGDIK